MSHSKNKPFTLYVLKHPETGEIRYAGITCGTLERRLSQHISNKAKCHRYFWIQKLKQSGLIPKIEPIADGLAFEQVVELEKLFIASFKEFGFDLTNCSAGGESGAFGRGISEYHSRRISECNAKRVWTPESRKKLSQTLSGRKQSPESNEKNRRSQLGRKHSKETLDRMSKFRTHFYEAKRCFEMLDEMWS